MTKPKESHYSDHGFQLKAARTSYSRDKSLAQAISVAFAGAIEERTIQYVLFDQVSAKQLAEAFAEQPIIIKPICALVNVASRAIKRDLLLTINMYGKKLALSKASLLAGYIKPMLPKDVAVPALLTLDQTAWLEKQLRATKGNWEARFSTILNQFASVEFRKRRFTQDNEQYELDAAYPAKGDQVRYAIDIKRIESPRDIHKRCDEIANKALHLKLAHVDAQFFAIVYYPFPSEHGNVRSRLNNSKVDTTYFAGETDESLKQAAKLLLSSIGKMKKGK